MVKVGEKAIVLLGGGEENPDESNILKIKSINWVLKTIIKNKNNIYVRREWKSE